MSDDNDSSGEWESGPFCQHWSQLGECEDPCACGHECRAHDWAGCDACDCETFTEPTP